MDSTRTEVTFIGGRDGEVDGPVSLAIEGLYTRSGLVGWLAILGYRVVRLIDVKEFDPA